MLKRTFVTLAVASASLCSFTSFAREAAPSLNQLLTQVPYSAVTALKHAPADEVLTYGTSSQQFIEAWLPTGKPIADLVFIHGGCWLSAYDIEHSRALTAALRDAGYRVWSLEYRRSGDDNVEDEGGWPDTYVDINAALTYLQTHKNISPANTVLLGHSAGGHLALLAAQEHPQYAGVVGLAAIADVVAYAKGDNSCQSVTEQFMGGSPENIPAEYKKANPKAHPMHTSTFLIYGDQDRIVPASQIDGLLSAKTGKVETIAVEGAGHFDFIHPGTTTFPVMLKAIEQALKR